MLLGDTSGADTSGAVTSGADTSGVDTNQIPSSYAVHYHTGLKPFLVEVQLTGLASEIKTAVDTLMSSLTSDQKEQLKSVLTSLQDKLELL